MEDNIRVIAVLLVEDNSNKLWEVVDAIKNQTRACDDLFAVQVAGKNNNEKILCDAGFEIVTVDSISKNYSELSNNLSELFSAGESSNKNWLWILTPDSVPEENALYELLSAVEKAPSVVIAGMKQLTSTNHILDIGLTSTTLGRPANSIDRYEKDQGQYDGRSDVLAVNSAGMLVRYDIWEKLKGFDYNFDDISRDINFCWRARLAGHRVVVVSKAVMRRPVINKTTSYLKLRKAEIFTRLTNSSFLAFYPHILALFVAMFFRAIFWVFVKHPKRSLLEFVALISSFSNPIKILSSRRKINRVRVLPRKIVRDLQLSKLEVFLQFRDILGNRSSELFLDEESRESSNRFSLISKHFFILIFLLICFSVSIFFKLLASLPVSGGALLSAEFSVTQLWEHLNSGWLNVDVGMPVSADPFGYVMLIISLLFFGNTQFGVMFLMLFAVPLAGMSMWFTVANMTGKNSIRFAISIAWAMSPSLLFSVFQGRINSVVLYILLPMFFLALCFSLGLSFRKNIFNINIQDIFDKREPSLPAAATAAILLAFMVACFPILLGFIIILLIILAIIVRRRAIYLPVVAFPSLILLGKFIIDSKDMLLVLFASAGDLLEYSVPSMGELFLGFPAATHLSDLYNFEVLKNFNFLLFALNALTFMFIFIGASLAFFVLHRFFYFTYFMFFSALCGIILAFGATQTAVGISRKGVVNAWPSVGLAIFLFSFLIILLLAANASFVQKKVIFFSRTIKFVIGSLVCISLVGLGVTSVGSLLDLDKRMLLSNGDVQRLPALAADSGMGKYETRALVFYAGDSENIVVNLVRGSGINFLQSSTIYDYSIMEEIVSADNSSSIVDAYGEINELSANIISGNNVDIRKSLFDLGVGYIVLHHESNNAENIAETIDLVPGFSRVSGTDSGYFWTVDPLVKNNNTNNFQDQAARVRIISNSTDISNIPVESKANRVDFFVAESNKGGILSLAESSNPKWRAKFQGTELQKVPGSWNQRFSIPSGSGQLEIFYDDLYSKLVNIAILLVFIIIFLLALPIPNLKLLEEEHNKEYRRLLLEDRAI